MLFSERLKRPVFKIIGNVRPDTIFTWYFHWYEVILIINLMWYSTSL